MIRILLAAALLLASLTTAFLIEEEKTNINWPFIICGQSGLKITSLSLSAYPTKSSGEIVILASGFAKYPMELDHVDMDAKLNGLPIENGTVSFTNTYDTDDQIIFPFSNILSPSLPSGTYTETLNFIDENGDDQGCFIFSFKL